MKEGEIAAEDHVDKQTAEKEGPIPDPWFRRWPLLGRNSLSLVLPSGLPVLWLRDLASRTEKGSSARSCEHGKNREQRIYEADLLMGDERHGNNSCADSPR